MWPFKKKSAPRDEGAASTEPAGGSGAARIVGHPVHVSVRPPGVKKLSTKDAAGIERNDARLERLRAAVRKTEGRVLAIEDAGLKPPVRLLDALDELRRERDRRELEQQDVYARIVAEKRGEAE